MIDLINNLLIINLVLIITYYDQLSILINDIDL